MRFSSVVLPEPDGPISATKSPWLDIEIDVVQDFHLLLATLVDLADLPDLNQCAHGGLTAC